MDEQEFIYVVSNPSIPNKVKVGRTSNLKNRIKQLQSTGVPTPYHYDFVALVENSVSAEKTAHHALRFDRVRSNREFFNVSPEVAIKKITAELVYFKVYWAYTPRNPITLQVQENYTRQAKFKINAVVKKLERIYIDRKDLKKYCLENIEKLEAAKLSLPPQINLMVRATTKLFNLRNQEVEHRQTQLLKIVQLEDLIKAQTDEISSLQMEIDSLNQDLNYLRDFYKTNLTESKIQVDESKKGQNRQSFKWIRESENTFKYSSNPSVKIKSSVVIIQPGREGVLLTDESGKEIFVDSDDVLNFWLY